MLAGPSSLAKTHSHFYKLVTFVFFDQEMKRKKNVTRNIKKKLGSEIKIINCPEYIIGNVLILLEVVINTCQTFKDFFLFP